MARDFGCRVVAENASLRRDDVRYRQTVQRDEVGKIADRRCEHEARRKMMEPKIRPEVGTVPIRGTAIRKLHAPASHQTNRNDDGDADRQREQSAPLAGCRKAEDKTCQREVAMRPRLAETAQEGCDGKQAEGEC